MTLQVKRLIKAHSHEHGTETPDQFVARVLRDGRAQRKFEAQDRALEARSVRRYLQNDWAGSTTDSVVYAISVAGMALCALVILLLAGCATCPSDYHADGTKRPAAGLATDFVLDTINNAIL